MRAKDYFGGELFLAVIDKLARNQGSERAMGATGIVVHPPHFDDRPSRSEGGESAHGQNTLRVIVH